MTTNIHVNLKCCSRLCNNKGECFRGVAEVYFKPHTRGLVGSIPTTHIERSSGNNAGRPFFLKRNLPRFF